jgi:hypothetical protein
MMMILCSGQKRQTAQKQEHMTGIGEAADFQKELDRGRSTVHQILKQNKLPNKPRQHVYKF